ncbi:MAG: aminoglycoside phosphotransferase family protein [Pseudomonadota bacterium]
MDRRLTHYSRLWDLRPLGKLTEDRPTSHVYKVQHEARPAVLKILTAKGMKDERHGSTALACWRGQGAARLYRSDEGAHLLEFVNGQDCVSLVRQGQDEDALAIIGETLARIHGAYPAPPPERLTALEYRFRELFDVARRLGIDPIFERGAQTAQDFLDAPLKEAVLHGDLHHENVLHSSERGWLAIDAKGLRGETTYDGAPAVMNPNGVDHLIESPERIRSIVAILAESMGVSDQRLLRYTFAHACLSASWSMETVTSSSPHALKMARIIEPML